jgi:hypothetical protein
MPTPTNTGVGLNSPCSNDRMAQMVQRQAATSASGPVPSHARRNAISKKCRIAVDYPIQRLASLRLPLLAV